MDKFKNKYRIQSHRKPHWDYSADAFYFLTIVTQNRKCILGEFVKTKSVDKQGRVCQSNEMILTDFGKIVENEWHKSFEIRNELFLHEFILMPNHLHAIVEIYNENRDGTVGDVDNGMVDIGAPDDGAVVDGAVVDGAAVEMHGRASLPIRPNRPNRPNRPIQPIQPIDTNEPELSLIKRNTPIRLPKSISSFIAGFKSAVNTKIDDYIDEYQLDIPKYNKNNHFFQPNYHDHIIRNHIEFQIISKYIVNNPVNWNKDKFYG